MDDFVYEAECYEIIYDWSGEYDEALNITERFDGSYEELQEYIKQMKKNGCYNITASLIEW